MPRDFFTPICPLMSGPSGQDGTSFEDCMKSACALYDHDECALLAFLRREPSPPGPPTRPMSTGGADCAPGGMHRLSVDIDGRRVLELDAVRIEVKPDFDVTRYPSISCDSYGFNEVLPKYVIVAHLPPEVALAENR